MALKEKVALNVESASPGPGNSLLYYSSLAHFLNVQFLNNFPYQEIGLPFLRAVPF